MKTSSRLARMLCVVGLAASSRVALADNQWTGYSTGNNNWSDTTNWYGFDRPDNNSSDQASFLSDTPRRTSTVNQDYAIGSLYFGNGLFGNQSMTINGTGTLGLKSGIDSRSSAQQNVSCPIRIDANQSFRNDVGGDHGYLYVSGSVNLNGHNLQLIPSSNSLSVAGAISGSGSIYVNGTGYANFEGTGSSWTGNLFINKGTVQYDSDSVFGNAASTIWFNQTDQDYIPALQRNSTGTTARPVNFEGANEGDIATPSNTVHTFTGNFTGTGLLGKTGAGTMVLAGTSGGIGGTSFGGKVQVKAGTLEVSGGPHLPTNRITVDSGATLKIDDGITDLIGTLQGAGTVQMGNGAQLNLGSPGETNVDKNGTGNWQGQIIGNNAHILKNGSGTWSVTKNNIYSGTTDVINGVLYADNDAGSATGTSAVNVNGGGTLTGTGTVSGVVTVSTGGTLSPGFAIDGQTYSGLVAQTGGHLNIELDAVAIDKLTVTSNATLSGGAVTFVSANGISIINAAAYREFLHVNGTITGAFLVSNARQSNGSYLAVTYGPHSAYVSLAHAADASLDGKVDFADLLTLAQNFGATSGKSWSTGDFDGNGATDFADLLLLAQNFGFGTTGVIIGDGDLSTSFAADWALAQSLVPEPTILMTVVLPALMALRRGFRRA